MFDISALLNKKVSVVKDLPTENDLSETGIVVGGYLKNSQLILLIACEDGIREISTEPGRNAIKLVR